MIEIGLRTVFLDSISQEVLLLTCSKHISTLAMQKLYHFIEKVKFMFMFIGAPKGFFSMVCPIMSGI